ncbi:MAG: flagellar basal body P-ring formation protein FlgA [Gemmobacter sp.]|jgi:flagella basal body P-ring formation protein FlgA|nr:flagellar basal body P-ring formation protein FlgA [Gemmobacter sp.]
MRALLLLCFCTPAVAETVVAQRIIRAQQIVVAEDLALSPTSVAGAISDLALVVGQEARVAIYAGHPLRATDLGPPAVIARNQVVPLVWHSGPLRILTEGRALERAGPGDSLRVMNLSSRTTVTGRVAADGSVIVGPES